MVLTIWLGAIACGNDDRPSQNRERARTQSMTFADIGIEASFGVREQSDPLSLIRQPLDAAFLGTEVLILDSSPPFVRIFDRSGEFRGFMLRQGDGPAEANRPSSISTTAAGNILVNHVRGFTLLTRDGTPLSFVRRVGHASRGVVEACDGQLVALVSVGRSEPRLLGKIRSDRALEEGVEDTLVWLGPERRNDRAHHTWFVEPGPARILFYTEEQDSNRLLDVACHDGSYRELPLDSLGPPETATMLDANTFSVRLPQPPFPAGVARLGDRIVWASQVIDPRGPDSLTVFTVFGEDDQTRSIGILGWMQILDSDPDGMLLMGNSYRRAMIDGLYPRVVMVSGTHLLEVIDSLGSADDR